MWTGLGVQAERHELHPAEPSDMACGDESPGSRGPEGGLYFAADAL